MTIEGFIGSLSMSFILTVLLFRAVDYMNRKRRP